MLSTSYVTLALALLAGASAQQPLQAPPLDVNAQIGKLHFPITCNLLGLKQTFDVVASGESPAYAAQGAEYYVTDVVGNVTIPQSIVSLARLLGATYAEANTTIYINATNASPSVVVAYQDIINVNLPGKSNGYLRFPAGNGTIPKVGPFTVGTGSEPSLTLLGNVNIVLNLKNAQGKTVFGGLQITCARQNIDYVLAAVSVDQTGVTDTDYNPAPANGYVPDFGYVPENFVYGFFRFPYSCIFGPLGAQSLDLTIGGQLPTFLNPGETLSLTRATSFLRVPASLIKLAKEGFPTVATFFTNVTDFELGFTNTSPGSINAAQTPLITSVDVTDVDVSQPLFIPIPEFTPLTLSPVTVNNAVGQFVALSAGNATAYTELRNASGSKLFGFDITCSPIAYLELISVAITNQKPDNYTLGFKL